MPQLRRPRPEDGPAVSALIHACPPLDANSRYLHLIQCRHFADSCVVAERDGEILGWVSAHRPPAEPDQIFVWQVAVHPQARGLGLGARMLDALVALPAAAGAAWLTASITWGNAASWSLFGKFAERRGLGLESSPLFECERHFDGHHDTEWLVRIGPLDALSRKDKN